MTAYAAATATVTSFEKIRDAATNDMQNKPARSTVVTYRDVLERLFTWIRSRPGSPPEITLFGSRPRPNIISLIRPWLPICSRRHLRRCSAARAPACFRKGTLLGALFESLVTQSVRTYAQAAEARVSHLRTRHGDHEVDLILESNGGVLVIKVKLGQAPDDRDVRHLRWLERELGDRLLDAVVITTGPTAYRTPDGIAVIPAALLGP
jgi:predicted AAA+ superfamily ATPase